MSKGILRLTGALGLCAVLMGGAVALSTGATGAGPEPKTHIVKVVSDLEGFRMYFSPRHIRINPGDTVKWVNEKEIDHNVLSFPDGFPQGAEAFESEFLSKEGDTFSYTFEMPGIYEYHCMPHLIMGMHGSIVVGEPGDDMAFHVPTSEEIKAYRDKLLEYFDSEDIAKMGRVNQIN